VRAGDGDNFVVTQGVGEGLTSSPEGASVFACPCHFRRFFQFHRIGDNDEVALVRAGVGVANGDGNSFGHQTVSDEAGSAVTPGNSESLLVEHPGNPTHPGPANAHEEEPSALLRRIRTGEPFRSLVRAAHAFTAFWISLRTSSVASGRSHWASASRAWRAAFSSLNHLRIRTSKPAGVSSS
jgi:hypothetical protein